MVRRRGSSWEADGITVEGRRERTSFPTEGQAKKYEKALLHYSSKQSVGHLFPILADECWPPGEFRDPSIKGRVDDLCREIGPRVSIRNIDDDCIEELKRRLAAKGNKPSTVANKLNALKKMLRRAKKRNYIDHMPEIEVKRGRMIHRTFVLTPEQEDALISGLPERWQPFAIFLIDTASRGFSECRHLEWHHVDFASRTCSFWYNKTDRPRSVKLTQDALAILKANKEAGWEKPWSILGTPGMSYRMWNQFWDKSRRAAGLPTEGLGAVVAYTCRHTTATRHARNGMDVLKLADLLGHSNLSTTRRYVHQDVEDQDEFVQKIERQRNLKRTEAS